MVKGLKINFMQTGTVAALLTASVLLVSWLFSTFLKTTVTPLFASVPAVSAVTGTIGEKILGLVSGIIPLGDIIGFGILSLFISSFVILLAGEWIIDNFKAPVFKGFLGMNGRVGRLASIIMYGAIPAYLLLIGITVPSVMTLVGLAIHTISTALITVTAANMLKINI